jgi:hypothetical protein
MTVRILLAASTLLALAGCNVTKDQANDTTLISVDHDKIGNVADDVGNTAGALAKDAGNAVDNAGPIIENTADTIGTRAKRVGANAKNAVDNTHVDITTTNTADDHAKDGKH